ncbi:hypothetical protein FAM09_04770 [Niastella caeni]|uniref:Uncharacterized protein n=1 Tax=Niastella caeni TaxID=2569763 RepID=A0A4S8I0M6_9BACT|nr:hypothetical protein [Niastella caeni]THU41425.1 hypothetical protein FAM09_04770 [Niastella caeni]
MEYPQSTQSATQNDTAVKKAAEEAYTEFVQQIAKPQSRGFISESGGRKIFSFETYLRETGISAELIQVYCNHIKTTSFVPKLSKQVSYLFTVDNTKALTKVLLYAMMPGICIYLLVAGFLWTFDISLWIPFLSFTLAGPILLILTMYYKFHQGKRQNKARKTEPSFFIKHFDDDEFTYMKSKNRLFVEK